MKNIKIVSFKLPIDEVFSDNVWMWQACTFSKDFEIIGLTLSFLLLHDTPVVLSETLRDTKIAFHLRNPKSEQYGDYFKVSHVLRGNQFIDDVTGRVLGIILNEKGKAE